MAQLQTKILYGLRTDVSGNAYFVNDEEVIYLVGNALALHNFSRHRQKLVRLSDKQKINTTAMSPNRKFIALCEEGQRPLISIYDLQKLKRRKVLGIPYEMPGVTKFSCLTFANDSKHLIAVTGEPTPTMLFYNWEKGKVESSCDVGYSQNPDSRITCVAGNPVDLGIVALGGAYAFKFLTVSETLWRVYGFNKADSLLVTSMAWISQERLLATLKDGRVMFFENGDLKNIFVLRDVEALNFKLKEEFSLQNQSKESDDENYEITTIVSFARGLALDHGPGKLVIFEKDGPNKYVKKDTFRVPEQAFRNDEPLRYEINVICPNPSNDRLLVTCRGWAQFFCVSLWKAEANSLMTVMGDPLHNGRIGGLSMSVWKSSFLTFGEEDRSVRLWDFENECLVMTKQFDEDVHSVCLHPTGLFCLVGFNDKLRFMNIFIDDFVVMHEFPIRYCRITAFSNGGHLFAAVDGKVIHVYSSVDFEKRFFLRGHNSDIKSMIWSTNDRKLVSGGIDGSICEWNTNSGDKISEMIIKDVTLNGLVLAKDGVTIFCISSKGRIHEIKNATVVQEYGLPNITPISFIQGKEECFMFLTYPTGSIASLEIPLKDPVKLKEYKVLNADISQMALTHNQLTLITTGADGTLCFWKIIAEDIVTAGLEYVYANQVLIDREIVAEQLQRIKELTIRIKELETEHDYVITQMTNRNNDKLREIHTVYTEAIQELRSKIDLMEEDHMNEMNATQVELRDTVTRHEEEMRKVEMNYDARLIVEYGKYEDLEEKLSQTVQEYEEKLAALKESCNQQMIQARSEFEAQLCAKEQRIQDIRDKMAQQLELYEATKLQMEEENERELIDVKSGYEASLHEERQVILKLKGEAGVLRNRHNVNLKEIELLNRQLAVVRSEHAELTREKVDLEREIENLSQEVENEKLATKSKDRTIEELTKANDELEKYKFVLNHRIQELNLQIEPRDREIAELKAKIQDMETELLSLNKLNMSLRLNINELGEKLASGKHETKMAIKRHKRCLESFGKLRVAVLDAAGLIHEPTALKSYVIKLYQRYSANSDFHRDHQADLEAQGEFAKQRAHMERTIALLKKRLKGNETADKIIYRNVAMMTDLNELKEELRSAHQRVLDMEKLTSFGEMELSQKKQMMDCQESIGLLKQSMERLIGSLESRAEKDPKKFEKRFTL